MTTRTTRKTVTFRRPFSLSAVDEVLPPGTYAVDNDEELIDGLSFLAYRCIATLLHLPCISNRGVSEVVVIDPSPCDQCPLLGVKRTSLRHPVMSAFDPKRTFEWRQSMSVIGVRRTSNLDQTRSVANASVIGLGACDHPPHGITLCRELIAVAVAQIDRDPVVRDRLV